MGKSRGVIIINRNLVNKVTEDRKPPRSSDVKVVVHRPPLQLAVQEGLVVAWKESVSIVFQSRFSTISSWKLLHDVVDCIEENFFGNLGLFWEIKTPCQNHDSFDCSLLVILNDFVIFK